MSLLLAPTPGCLPCSTRSLCTSRPGIAPLYKSSGLSCQRRRRAAGVLYQQRLRAPVAAAASQAPTALDYVDEESQAIAVPHSGQEASAPAYDYTAHWWPIAFVNDIDPSVPYRFVLLGIPLVIWHDTKAKQIRVFKDVCPHRLVPLSEGRVNAQGLLECGYHGWAFSGSGKCEVIPQGAPAGCNSPRACATAFPCAVRQGLLFVKPQALPNPLLTAAINGNGANGDMHQGSAVINEADIPIVQQLEEDGWISTDTWRDVPLDWATVLENVLDSSHVPFTHHKSISNRNDIGDYITKLTSPVTREGFTGVWPTGPRAGAMGPQSCYFRPPAYMHHQLDGSAKRGMESMVVVYAVPSAPGHCRLINRNLVKFTKTKLPSRIFKHIPQFLIHIGTQVPLEDDQIFLHLGERQYNEQRAAGQKLGQAYYMPSQADVYIAAFRRWVDSFGGGGPFGPIDQHYVANMDPRLDRDTLLDRYSQHTQNCYQCQQGLAKVRTAKQAAAGVGWVACGLAIFTAAVAVASASGSGSGLAAGAAAAAAGGGAAGGSLSVVQSALAAFSGGVLAFGEAVAGGGGPEGQVLRALLWGALAALGGLSSRALAGFETKFYKGDYPPPRNLDKS